MRRLAFVLLLLGFAPADRKPSILLIVTDDQGYGDLGIHGNKDVHTPHLDALAASGVRIDPFFVCPVCSPTRSSLLTGRYNYRTGIVDTFLGRSMMHPDEVTLPEMLAPAGYRTGIFGKWHLGDNYPLRPQDHQFQECLTIRGGGLGQPSDPPGGDHYTDPTLYRNGAAFKSKGYCTDVLTDGALKFIEAAPEKPFFAYVAYNAPHTPLETPAGYPLDPNLPESTARLYAMLANIDDNVGRLLKKLDELRIAEDTIVIFMSDNGPEGRRYNAGLRGLKGTCFEGGIRVPFFIRWAGHFKGGRVVQTPFAHIDVAPTLVELAGLEWPQVLKDGTSFAPWLRGSDGSLPRTLFFQWHRGDVPERFRACAARSTEWKAVWLDPTKTPLLFHISEDPTESKDVAAAHPEELAQLTKEYERWFESVSATRGFAPPRIILGTEHEDPAVLTRQNWRMTPNGVGVWLVELPAQVSLDVTLRFKAPGATVPFSYRCGLLSANMEISDETTSVLLQKLPHQKGVADLVVTIGAKKPYGPDYVELKRSAP
jgi:arylsulfatase A-like enzyme